MSSFSFTDPITGKVFKMDAPSGVSFDQAQAMFKQQLDGGSLAGYKVGDVLSSATQAAGGLTSALPNLQQSLAQAAGQLPIGASLNTITSALGPAGAAAAAQLQSSLQGQGFPAATNAINGALSGATGALSGAIAGATGALSGAVKNVTGSVLKTGEALTGAIASAGSLATTSITNLTSSLTSTSVTNGINVADLVKQGIPGGIPDLSSVNLQAAMSQASKLVGQPHTVISDDLGVGKFGFDIPQLEKAGFVKPGISAITGAAASLTSVLGSASVWTGKDGIKSVDGILNNAGLQDNIQKGLMSSGLSDLKTLGVPVDKLNPQAIAGLANNAAKSVESTLKNLQGSVVLPDVKAEFDTVNRDSAYAVDFAEEKVEPEVFGENPAEPAENTVDDETLIAAADRIIGNDKVPDVTMAA
mgnify:CR=1 FL=1